MRFIVFIICSFICFSSCKESYPDYDETPVVEFVSATTSSDESDKKVAFTFALYDGDGDIGLSEKDTIPPFVDSFQQNFYATAFYIDNGDTTALPYNFSYRIPRLRDEGNDKFIKANVTVTMSFAKSVFTYDSVLFQYFVYDRKLHKSNVDTSSVIEFRSKR